MKPAMSPLWLCWCADVLLTWVSTAADIPQDDECKDYGVPFERVFRRSGEAAMFNCSLVDPRVFNVSTHPYNTTWYHLPTGQEQRAHMEHTIIQGTTLWLLNITAEDKGKFMCVVRTAEGCFKQAYVLMVEAEPGAGPDRGCVHRERSIQFLPALTSSFLSCPLREYLPYLDTYTIHWYRSCEVLPINGKFLVMGEGDLVVDSVAPDDADNYTCVLSFQLAGLQGLMSETIETTVLVKVTYQPEILLPDGEINKVPLGSSFHKLCRVSVPGVGSHDVLVIWRTQDKYINYNTTHRIHQLPQREVPVADGSVVEADLVFSEVREEDLNVNFTCEVHNDRRVPQASFRLQSDPNLLLPLGLVFGASAFMFVQCVLLYRLFKMDIALACRDALPHLYPSTEGDGKVYDAYVVYPRLIGQPGSPEETFVLSTIPQMLEGHYGYRLFILGRDCMPGEALVDAVCSALSLSRRVLLIYGGGRGQSCDDDWGAWLEQQLALQRSLLEDNTLGVILIDLGGVSDSALPPALRLLKEEQGALRPAHTHTLTHTLTHTHGCCCSRSEEEAQEEEEALAFITPSRRFWKELRYHMPIRGKRRTGAHIHTHTHNTQPQSET
ncbi:interleukin-1 receptor type 1 isoform X1 [Alosa alosa]|uniref:interleukin-1 receptor type 1 isoform X1 n=1 Tax=Alosa alosa TaxID=278164 RepID=UPI0020153F76|nr:interleukin-1 receptor type 1 isoform X1 [Alosa alosa]